MEPAENRIRRIVLERLGTCRVCHRTHEGDDVSVVSQKPDVWMMVVECPDCHTRSFVAAVVDERHADEAKMALRRLAGEQLHTDGIDVRIDENEMLEYVQQAEPLTEQDVDEMKGFLETFNGDFKRLFAED